LTGMGLQGIPLPGPAARFGSEPRFCSTSSGRMQKTAGLWQGNLSFSHHKWLYLCILVGACGCQVGGCHSAWKASCCLGTNQGYCKRATHFQRISICSQNPVSACGPHVWPGKVSTDKGDVGEVGEVCYWDGPLHAEIKSMIVAGGWPWLCIWEGREGRKGERLGSLGFRV